MSEDTQTTERNKVVPAAELVKAYVAVANQTDENGEKDGSYAVLAEKLDMKIDSLRQRVGQLKRAGVALPDMPRAKGGGKKRDIAGLNELIGNLNSELGIDEDETSDE